MATFSFVLAEHKKATGRQAIRFRVIENRKTAYYATNFEIESKYWDEKKERVKHIYPNAVVINEALHSILLAAERAYAEMVAEGFKPDAKTIIDAAFTDEDFYKAAERFIKNARSVGTKARYKAVISKLKAIAPTLKSKELTPQLLQKFVDYYTQGSGRYGIGNTMSTISANLAVIKAIVNSSKTLRKNNPFDDFKIPAQRPAKRATLTLDEIRMLESYQPTGYWDGLTKDTFLFAFYVAGMRIGDVLSLRWENVKGGILNYAQQKVKGSSGVVLTIPLHEKALDILSRYDRSTSTVFDVIPDGLSSEEEYAKKKRAVVMINGELKKIMQRLGIAKDISTHCARHTFAQIANQLSGRDVYSIKTALGHTKMATTEIYLGNDQSAIAELLKKVYG